MLPLYKVLCVSCWLHGGEAKGTACRLAGNFIDPLLFWEVSWENFQTGGKGLMTNDSKNRASHLQLLCLFCFHQIFFMWALKDEEAAKGHSAIHFLKAKYPQVTKHHSEVKLLPYVKTFPAHTGVSVWIHMRTCWAWRLWSCVLQKPHRHKRCGLCSSPHSNSYPRETEPQTCDNLTVIRDPPSLILPQSMLWRNSWVLTCPQPMQRNSS